MARAPDAHKGRISGLCWADETRVLSCGVDNNVKMWDMRSSVDNVDEMGAGPSEVRQSSFFSFPKTNPEILVAEAIESIPWQDCLQVSSSPLCLRPLGS